MICGVCIFYTTIGGLKAVVWTDTLQFIITVGAMVTVLVLGAAETGGFLHAWNTAVKGHRLDLFELSKKNITLHNSFYKFICSFDVDPTKRDTFWTVTVGFTIHWICATCMSQGCVQKFLAVSTLKESRM